MKALITRKLGMTSTISEDGEVVAVTLLSVGKHTVIAHKNMDSDGYTAVQIGAENSNKLSKSLAGHVKASNASPKVIREFRIAQIPDEMSVGANINADIFNVGDLVNATGTTKGKGWAGTIRRHNFHRGRKTHGGRSYRRVGSIGSMYPQRIFKGKKMAGQLGGNQVTVRNLKIALVDTENSLIGVTGAVPGPRKSIIILKGEK